MQSSRVTLLLMCFVGGCLFFFIKQRWLIIELSFPIKNTIQNVAPQAYNKQLAIFYMKHATWVQELVIIIWQKNNMYANLHAIITHWVQILEQEKLLPLHIKIQHVALSGPGNELYISFDRSLFLENDSIVKKWASVASLCKTINRAGLAISNIMLLVNNRPMADEHIECAMILPMYERL